MKQIQLEMDEFEANEVLRHKFMDQVIKGLGKPLAPKTSRFVQDIPKTRNAKLMRRGIRATYLGEDPCDLIALLNPEAIGKIRNAV